MISQSSSFQRKNGSRVPFILGTKPSIQNAQLLISSGVPSFDHLTGGGLPIGTVILIEEDLYGNFATLFLKYFLAEGIISQHDIFAGSQDIDPVKLMEELPKPIVKDDANDHSHLNSCDKMSIAWRYENLPSVEFNTDSDYGHYFDITQYISKVDLEKVSVTYWHRNEVNDALDEDCDKSYDSILKLIRKRIDDGLYNVSDNPKKRNVLRIGIHSVGSPLWESNCAHLLSFIFNLKALISSSYCVCLLTVPSHLKKKSTIQKCQHISDISVKLESFAGSGMEANPILQEYHGFFHINKLPAINSLTSHVPGTFDLAFKLRRKKFSIEVLHLPPELQGTTQREQDEYGCSPSGKKIDF